MIQDLGPLKYRVEYRDGQPEEDFPLIFCREGAICLGQSEEGIIFPKRRDLPSEGLRFRYGFAVGDQSYYLAFEEAGEWDAAGGTFSFVRVQDLRGGRPSDRIFAAVTGFQLWDWYEAHRFCGHCGITNIHSDKERMVACPSCGRTFYPHISPAVIVGVIHRGRLLMSKYAGRSYTRFALIAGFTEIGEGIEDTVHREVREEVGLPVKNLRYYKSQPWAFSSSLLMGFFCDLDGDDESITLDEEELAMAGFYDPSQVPEDLEKVALTSEMMEVFRRNAGAESALDLKW